MKDPITNAVEGMRTAIGSVAEIASIYYFALIDKGIPLDIATDLTQSFVGDFLRFVIGKKKEEGDDDGL